MGHDWHRICFEGLGSWLNSITSGELTDQERVDLAWCEYADALNGEEDFDGPAMEACFNLVLKRYGLKPTNPKPAGGE